ncbi:helix-turn-helix domain-containing protein [Streptomyces gamaensis]|uniref:Helix-turn-helix domain-containing protein n=1 Tax=Streptomyces gamaensis TaxID=1763542 RepID=A0ABW0YZD5_9ACTN
MTETQPIAQAPCHSTSSVVPLRGVTHVRHRHTDRFTVIGNHLALHASLSLVARGLAVYIQALPDGARIGIKQLAEVFPEGATVIGRALNELEAAGYLLRKRVRGKDGRVRTRTTWYEHPGARWGKVPGGTAVPAGTGRTPADGTGHPEPQLPTRTDRTPANVPAAAPTPTRATPELPPVDQEPVDQEAADILASLRRRDPRLLLSGRDIRHMAPLVRTWLDRGIGPHQLRHTLTRELPAEGLKWPARILTHRLTDWLPPALPTSVPAAAPKPEPVRPHPLRNCDGCDRAFRAPHPGLCRDCREAAA